MSWQRYLAYFCTCMTSGVSIAQSSDAEPVFMLGQGALSCEQLLNYTSENGSPNDLVPWIYGFWSGINVVRGSSDDGDVSLAGPLVDPAALQSWIAASCELDLERKIYSVAMEAYFELSR
ncbi:hypothetical protein DEA8626_01963 [Defluviimonas aquaemixtae]|uniref:Rap1a immunity protein domain-containing protein n=1 Tax=Albidovulum aquaemixtae TaxID=1542388 RepID=A0A2R8B711_9RHOB|nr:hypothetical protein [Defluviimonas aquaemixtae]SPH18425.1 hypothetical protein DEA8626_01963 [Defluviimonas aquaemixtae]